tara:strand:+ start:513 stop:1163 length:651 start_codon:yes stop_codon:yes gene_type:complete
MVELVKRYQNALKEISINNLGGIISDLNLEKRYEEGFDFYGSTFWTDISSPTLSSVETILVELVQYANISVSRCDGIEWWLSVQDVNKTPQWLLRPHFDRDDISKSMSENSRSPEMSSVLFLNDLPYGELVVMDQKFLKGSIVPDEPTSMTFIRPERNLYAVFPGYLYHGVIGRMWRPYCQCSLRITIAINYWRNKPRAKYMRLGNKFQNAFAPKG